MINYKISTGVVCNISDESVIISSDDTKMLYILSGAESEIIKMIEAGADYISIVDSLKEQYVGDVAIIEKDVGEFINALIDAKIIEQVVCDDA